METAVAGRTSLEGRELLLRLVHFPRPYAGGGGRQRLVFVEPEEVRCHRNETKLPPVGELAGSTGISEWKSTALMHTEDHMRIPNLMQNKLLCSPRTAMSSLAAGLLQLQARAILSTAYWVCTQGVLTGY